MEQRELGAGEGVVFEVPVGAAPVVVVGVLAESLQ